MRVYKTKQAGISMIEAMFGMAVVAAVSIAGVIAFGEVSSRQEANKLLAGMQGFNVDTRMYLENYHDEATELLPVTIDWTIDTTAKYTTEAKKGDLKCVTGTPGTGEGEIGTHALCPTGTVANTVVSNPNLNRIINMPGLKFSDGGHDDDSKLEMHIPIGTNQAIEIALAIHPGAAGASWTPPGNMGKNAEWAHCTFKGAGPNDVAMAVQYAIEDVEICGHMNNSISRYDHVQASQCVDADTTPPLDKLVTLPDGHSAALNVCYRTMR